MKFSMICTMLAARNCYNAGHTVAEIAIAAKRTPETIRRWLRTTGAVV